MPREAKKTSVGEIFISMMLLMAENNVYFYDTPSSLPSINVFLFQGKVSQEILTLDTKLLSKLKALYKCVSCNFA